MNILNSLQIYDLPQPEFIKKSLEELEIGTYSDIATVSLWKHSLLLMNPYKTD